MSEPTDMSAVDLLGTTGWRQQVVDLVTGPEARLITVRVMRLMATQRQPIPINAKTAVSGVTVRQARPEDAPIRDRIWEKLCDKWRDRLPFVHSPSLDESRERPDGLAHDVPLTVSTQRFDS